MLTGVPKIQILNSAERKHFIKDDIKIRQRPLKGKNFFQYFFILWPYLSLPPHEANRFCEICCKSLKPSAHTHTGSVCVGEGGSTAPASTALPQLGHYSSQQQQNCVSVCMCIQHQLIKPFCSLENVSSCKKKKKRRRMLKTREKSLSFFLQAEFFCYFVRQVLIVRQT